LTILPVKSAELSMERIPDAGTKAKMLYSFAAAEGGPDLD
jgi:hypothetical protein